MFVVTKKCEKTVVRVKWPILEIISTQTMLSSQLISFSSFSSVIAFGCTHSLRGLCVVESA